MENNNLFSFLFADYILALSDFFKSLSTYETRYDPVTGLEETLKPKVIYGQPTAAYRKIVQETINGRPVLPIISFVSLSMNRIKSRQNPYASYISSWMIDDFLEQSDEPYTSVTYAPQVYKITYNVSVWTRNNKTRDDIISRIVRFFNTTLTLRYYPNPTKYPDFFLYMPFEIEEEISDTTELEQLEEKDVRELIRTDFIITGEAVLPMSTNFYKGITSIGINIFESKVKAAKPNGQYRLDVISAIDEPLTFEINTQEKLE